METEPRPLFNRDVEDAFIGAALINPAGLEQIDLDPGDIYIQRNRWIYEAMRALQARRTEPDFITLTDELERQGRLAEIGGPAYLAGLLNATPTSLGMERYADIVRDYARRRRILLAANELAKAAYAESDIAEPVSAVVDQLTTGIRPKVGAVHWSGALGRLYDDVKERLENPTDTWGIPTGFVDYDQRTGGLQPGEVLYIGGEPGIGKSIWSMQIGLNIAGIYKRPGAIYSLEMQELQITRRAVSAGSLVETRKLKTGRLNDDEWQRFVHQIEVDTQFPIYLCDQSELTTSALRADLARLKLRHNIEWFVLDYLFLMADGDGKMDDNQRTALLSRRIKTIAGELGLAGITVNSVTKDAMDGGKPTQKNIRGSGQVVHDADVICFITKHIPDKSKWETENENLRTVTFGKGRELENPAPFHLVKLEKFPAFGNYAPEPNAQRPSTNGNGAYR